MNSVDLSGMGVTSQRARNRMIDELKAQGIQNQKVLNVMASMPRHIFLEDAFAHRAYENCSLPIGHSQTISHPYIVALMTELILSRGQPQRVLEVGTGSGYQAAVLSQLVEKVYSVERIKPLLMKARERFRAVGARNIISGHSDGGEGWGRYAPYDAILSTAAPEYLPDDLLHQVGYNGILVIPTGRANQQELRIIQRQGDTNNFDEDVIANVKFVPLLGGTV